MVVKYVLSILLSVLFTGLLQARENLNHLDYPAKEIGLKNGGTLLTLHEGSVLIALSDDLADIAQLLVIDGGGKIELVFHTRRIPRNPFYIAYERVIVDAPAGAEFRSFRGMLKTQMAATHGNEILLKNGGKAVLRLIANPTDPGISDSYVDEGVVDDLLQFVTEVLGAEETQRYPVLQIFRTVESASLYLKSHDGGKIVLGFRSLDGVDREVEIDDLGYEQIEIHQPAQVIKIDALPTHSPE